MRRYRNYDGEPEHSFKSEKPCRACVDVKTFLGDNRKSSLSSGSKLPTDCPLDKNDLGRASWSLLHTIAAYYPDKPNSQQQSDIKNLMDILSRLYPCKQCADDLINDLKDEPPVVSSRKDLSQWMCRLHNKVNNKLGKELFDCSKVDERWLNGWKDGSCG